MRFAMSCAILLAVASCKARPRSAVVVMAPDAAVASTPPAPSTPDAGAPIDSGAVVNETRREDLREVLFGVEVRDPYRWLEDASKAEVKSWMVSQAHTTQETLAAHPERAAIVERLRALIYVESISAPVRRGSRWFFSKKDQDGEKSVLYVRDGKNAPPRVLIDPLVLEPKGTIALGVWVPSWDGKYLAYSLKENNADEATLYVMEVATGKGSLADVIEGAKYASPSWTPNGSGFFYTWLPTDPSIAVADRPGYAEVRFHKLGTDPKSDEIVHPKLGDPTRFLGASMTRDGKYLFLYKWHGWSENDLYVQYQDPAGKKRGFVPIAEGKPFRYSVESHAGRFYLMTNEEAPRWKIFSVDPKKLDRAAWKEVVPEDPEAVLSSFSIVGGHLGLAYIERASSRLQIHNLSGKKTRDVQLPAIGTASGFIGLPEDDEAYFGFSSFTHAPEIQAISISTGKTSLYDRIEMPIDSSVFEVHQLWYPSKDNTPISLFLVGKKGAVKDGKSPLLLGGYGGFNISILPVFSASLYPWLERGGLVAIANLRGGGEYGEAWHRAGMREKKQNVFDDFIAAAEYLIREGWTAPSRLAITGRSNGGLLVAAAMTQRPELFGAVICGVPLADMVRYAEFGSGKTWIAEYGDPSVEADFKFLYAYSPYHHLREGVAYPPVLITSVDSDDRVDPMHARKFAAAAQAVSESPVLLRIEMNAGHGGADLRRSAIEQAADEIVFLLGTVAKE